MRFRLIRAVSTRRTQSCIDPAFWAEQCWRLPDGRARSINARDVLHPESKQQTTPAAPRDALECVAALARTREDRQNCVRFAYLGPQVDRLHVLELKRDVE